MADDRGCSPSTVVLAFLSGAAVGAVAALLLAPQSGKESREQLRGYARRAEDCLREVAGRAGEAVDQAVDKGRDFVKEKKTVLTEAFEAGRDAMKRERDRLLGDKNA
jgi:gas vesicle protein